MSLALPPFRGTRSAKKFRTNNDALLMAPPPSLWVCPVSANGSRTKDCLHSTLWHKKSFFWHSREQYQTCLQPPHRNKFVFVFDGSSSRRLVDKQRAQRSCRWSRSNAWAVGRFRRITSPARNLRREKARRSHRVWRVRASTAPGILQQPKSKSRSSLLVILQNQMTTS